MPSVMLTVDEALETVLAAAGASGLLPAETVALQEAAGRVLRETIRADRDMPPFTRSAMDGYALRAADTSRTPALLEVVEEIPAGRQPNRPVGPGQASRIMTGAALPQGADAVQMVEKTESPDASHVRILEPVEPGAHVRSAGEEMERGEILLDSGEDLGASAIALLASSGCPRVRVAPRPRVAIVPTGDELVPVERSPGPSQIRESNGHALRALVERTGGEPRLLPIAADRREALARAIAGALAGSDLVLLSGGVSMGVYDLVGGVLRELGCPPLFERVAIQPGKPLYFGIGPAAGRPALVFGLPGNPVSSLVDFLVFARPAMRRLMGASRLEPALVRGRLAEPIRRRPGRRAYVPAAMEWGPDGLVLKPIPSMGSSDMVALSRADALAILPEASGELPAGVSVRALPLAGLTR